jgi:hypothetical protein
MPRMSQTCTNLMMARNRLEQLVAKMPGNKIDEKVNNAYRYRKIDYDTLQMFTAIRKAGNQAAHGGELCSLAQSRRFLDYLKYKRTI